MAHPSDRRNHTTGLPFLAIWLGMLAAGVFLITALFHGVGAVVAALLFWLF